MCGIYVPLAELADGRPHVFQMELTIPYQDFLMYQAFTLYPNTVPGELRELVHTSTAAFVWAPIDPYVRGAVHEFFNGVTLTHKTLLAISPPD